MPGGNRRSLVEVDFLGNLGVPGQRVHDDHVGLGVAERGVVDAVRAPDLLVLASLGKRSRWTRVTYSTSLRATMAGVSVSDSASSWPRAMSSSRTCGGSASDEGATSCTCTW